MSRKWSALILLIAAGAQALSAYSVLTHEAIVDTAWEDSLKPLLKARFPGVTDDQLREAHAFAYGGAIIQDAGYYPFGSRLFSDLVHYVRSGDFVVALLHDAQDVDQYAFALGALCHYAADNKGHPVAVNRVVPMLYPNLARKFGKIVTYEDNPTAHIKTEFGFDVLEVAHGNYAPQAYHDFVGFQVSKPLLEQAFQDTYCIPLKSVFANLDLAMGTYRRTVSSLIPSMTKAAWNAKKDEIGNSLPGVTRRRFVYNLSRASYEKEWGKDYERPGFGAKVLTFLFHLIPKVGPFRALGFRVPTPEAEKLFMQSFNDTLARAREAVREVRANNLQLQDSNLDTGELAAAGTYRMADQAYSKLLEKLADNGQNTAISPELRKSILAFFQKPNQHLSEKGRRELESLRQ